MSDKDLKLNSLSRYSKQSPNLILQEYGHCEVPAGCGGVVLRWRRPEEPISMSIRQFCGNSRIPRITLDGVELNNRSRIPITIGEHVLTLTLKEIDPAHALFILTGTLDPQDVRILKISTETPLLSLADGSWKYTFETPEDRTWEQHAYDDRSWKALVTRLFGPLTEIRRGNVSYWTRSMTERGAKGLGIDPGRSLFERIRATGTLPDPLPAIYVRKVFQVTQLETEE
ncbi:MAG: hypothetical protein JWL77_6361 [Chthonomonadaceae bacterium]|nr:hypothetical protein [Chthonomonadaceae bacterium]